MKFFIDTASVKEIQEAADLGLLDGVTTNPSLLSKETGLLAFGLIGLYFIVFQRKTEKFRRGPALAMLALAGAYLLVRFFWLENPPDFGESLSHAPLISLDWYLKTLVLPHPLSPYRTPTRFWRS